MMARAMEFLLMHRPPVTITDAYMRITPALDKKRVCEDNVKKEALVKSFEASYNTPSFTRRERRKSVHFADAKGLDLVTVHNHDEDDEDVIDQAAKESPSPSLHSRRDKLQMVDFLVKFETKQDFLEHLQTQKVYLENVYYLWEKEELAIGGTVRMENLAIEKVVTVRHTLDKWGNSSDEFALYKSTHHQKFNSGTLEIDTFTFQLSPIRTDPDIEEVEIELAVCYQVNGHEYWDNNGGFNYQVLMKRREANGILKDTTYEKSVEIEDPCIDWPCIIL